MAPAGPTVTEFIAVTRAPFVGTRARAHGLVEPLVADARAGHRLALARRISIPSRSILTCISVGAIRIDIAVTTAEEGLLSGADRHAVMLWASTVGVVHAALTDDAQLWDTDEHDVAAPGCRALAQEAVWTLVFARLSTEVTTLWMGDT